MCGVPGAFTSSVMFQRYRSLWYGSSGTVWLRQAWGLHFSILSTEAAWTIHGSLWGAWGLPYSRSLRGILFLRRFSTHLGGSLSHTTCRSLGGREGTMVTWKPLYWAGKRGDPREDLVIKLNRPVPPEATLKTSADFALWRHLCILEAAEKAWVAVTNWEGLLASELTFEAWDLSMLPKQNSVLTVEKGGRGRQKPPSMEKLTTKEIKYEVNKRLKT